MSNMCSDSVKTVYFQKMFKFYFVSAKQRNTVCLFYTKFPSESEHVHDLVSSVNNVTYMFDILKYKKGTEKINYAEIVV